MMLASLVLVAALPAGPAPLSQLDDLVGTWNCTYRAGAVRFGYVATYAYDLGGLLLRQSAAFAGGGDEELLAYDAKSGWTATVLDDHGNATVMHAPGRNPKHIAYRSVYPDGGIAVTFDRVSTKEYTLHATFRAGGKTTTSMDICLRGAHESP